MLDIKMSYEDFESLKKAAQQYNRDLQAKAGWKGHVQSFSFNRCDAVFNRIGSDSITIHSLDGEVGRLEFRSGVMRMSGELFDGCADAQSVARVLRSTCLSDGNVESLRRSTFGCCEMIPVVDRPGFRDGCPMYFFPEDRWDIRQCLIGKVGMFVEGRPDDYPKYAAEVERFISENACNPVPENMPRRYAVLFDGRDIHDMSEARYLSGELASGQVDNCYFAVRTVMFEAFMVGNELEARTFDNSPCVPTMFFSDAAFPVVSDSSVFIFREGRPQWGVYLNSAGHVTVCDGRGWAEVPAPAKWHDVALEALLNSPDEEAVSRGMRQCRTYMESCCLSEENVRIARQDMGRDEDQEIQPDSMEEEPVEEIVEEEFEVDEDESEEIVQGSSRGLKL